MTLVTQITPITPSESIATNSSNAFERIGKVLDYIHTNLNTSLSLEDIAKRSCWSRWQLQRVFQAETGVTVANYVRDLKLSIAAEQLIDTSSRIIDIAVDLGFNSEVSFSRAFKQSFGISPSKYRKNGLRIGLRQPMVAPSQSKTPIERSGFIDIRVDSRDSFVIKGLNDKISGLFSLSPDFATKVPLLWQQLESKAKKHDINVAGVIGVIDITQASFDGANICYWAGVELSEAALLPLLPSLVSEELESLTVPKQTYAVVKHRGPISTLPKTLEWFILNWLPSAGYRGIDGYELEKYPEHYDPLSDNAEMEYWLPIEKA